MAGLTYLLRMSRWARNPPSWQRVVLVFAVIAICLVLFAIDRLFGWPAWLTPNGMRGQLGR